LLTLHCCRSFGCTSLRRTSGRCGSDACRSGTCRSGTCRSGTCSPSRLAGCCHYSRPPGSTICASIIE
jgi:hypothetical protein